MHPDVSVPEWGCTDSIVFVKVLLTSVVLSPEVPTRPGGLGQKRPLEVTEGTNGSTVQNIGVSKSSLAATLTVAELDDRVRMRT